MAGVTEGVGSSQGRFEPKPLRMEGRMEELSEGGV